MFNVQCSICCTFAAEKEKNMKGMTPRIINCLKDYNRETFMKGIDYSYYYEQSD